MQRRSADHRRTGRVVSVIALFLTAAVQVDPGVARAATLDVCASGCTYTAISTALADAIDGDVITVGAGTYDERLIIGDDVAIIGAGAAVTTVNAGGSGTVVSVSPAADVVITDLTITGGSSIDNGGGVNNAGTILLERVNVVGNTVPDGGAGIFNTGTLTVNDSLIADNVGMTDGTGSIGGGGIASSGLAASVIVRRSTIARNSLVTPGTDQRGGGGVAAVNSALTIEDSRIVDNSSGYSSGGIYVSGSSATFELARSLVSGNRTGTDPARATGRGGGISVRSSATATITESAIVGNASASSGGGLHAAATTTLVNTTISGNFAATAGAGIHAEVGIELIGVTVADNSATTFGGGIYGFGNTITSDGIVVAGNSAGTDGPDCYTTIAAVAGTTSLVRQTDPTICVVAGAGLTLTGLDPMLGTLADNGGPTLTHLPLDGSPLIDATPTTLSIDQRGEPRPSGLRGDIGAVEVQAPAPAPPFELIPAWGGIGSDIGAQALPVDGQPLPCGWSPGETVEIWWDAPERSLGTTIVDADGCWEIAAFDTSERLGGSAPGAHKVIARGSLSGDAQARFELVERWVALDPGIGSSQREVAVSGCGWGGAVDVNVFWAETGELIGRSVGVDTGGCLSGVATIPRVRTNGLYAVVAADGVFPGPEPVADASATVFWVRPSTVFLTPSAGPPGGAVELAGCDWFPNEEVEFRSLRDDLVFDVIATVENGCFRSSGPQPLMMSIPDTASLGDHVIRATGSLSGQQIDTDFEVLEPYIAFDPASAATGEVVTVTGCGWTGNTQVTIEWGYPDTNSLPIRWSHPVDRNTGCLANSGLDIEVPSNTPAGRWLTVAEGDVSGRAVFRFEVTNAGTMTVLQPEAAAGGMVQVQIEHAIVGEVISFWLGNQFGDPDDTVGVVTPDFTTNVQLPTDAYVGANSLVAVGSKGFEARDNLEIIDASTLDVITAPLAANVLTEVIGTNWGSGERVDLSIRPAGSDDRGAALGSAVVADDSQEFSARFRLPADLTDGSYELMADGFLGRSAVVEVELVSPTLVASPPGAIAGGSVVVAGEHWSAGELVQFSFRHAASGALGPPGSATRADANGLIDDVVNVPFQLGDGGYELVATGTSGRSATAPMWVGERTLALTITEVRLLGSTFDGFDSPGDMYARLRVDAPGFTPLDVDVMDQRTIDIDIADPMWTQAFSVPLAAPRVLPIEVSLFDWDSGDPALHPQADINPASGENSIVINVDLVDGSWNGAPYGQGCTQGEVIDTAVAVCFVTSVVSPSGDIDGDGFLDRWEMDGIDYDGDAVPEVDLPALGADPCQATVIVEYSSMAGSGVDFKPLDDSIASVAASFEAAPIDAPAGCDFAGGVAVPGIQLLTNFLGYELYQAEYGCGNIATDRNRRQDALRRRLFHYAMFVDRLPKTSSSGVACGDGKIIIALGNPSSDLTRRLVNESSTYMHELGHALGFRHGGFENRNYKPNYLSVMNYRFQLAGQYSSDGSRFVLDYSRELLPSLDESALIEAALTTADLETAWSSVGDPNVKIKGAANTAIDWNGDGPTPTAQPYGQDLNGDSWCVRPGDDKVLDTVPAPESDDVVARDLNSGAQQIWAGPDGICDTEADATSDDEQVWGLDANTWTVLRGHDDWSAIKLRARNNLRGSGLDLDQIPDDPELTVEQLDEQFDLWFSPSLDVVDRTVVVTLGETATNAGFVADRDGDQATLSASVGAVTDLGDGSWSWTYTPAAAGNSLVTITATDEEGSTSVSFALEVNVEVVNGGDVVGAGSFTWPGTGERAFLSVHGSAEPGSLEPTGSLLFGRSTGDDPMIVQVHSLETLTSGELDGGGTWAQMSGNAVIIRRGHGPSDDGATLMVRVEDRGRGNDLVTVQLLDVSGGLLTGTDGPVRLDRGNLRVDAASRHAR